MKKIKIGAIIQARRNSSRLKDKIFLKLKNKPLIFHVIQRLKKSKFIDEIVVATTKKDIDLKICEWCKKNNIKFYRGKENDVLDRFYKTSLKFNMDLIIRVTADDPFKDYKLIDFGISIIKDQNLDYVCNNNPPTFPEGLDVEVFTFNTLKKCKMKSKTSFQKEHVTQYIVQNPNEFNFFNFKNKIDLSKHRWTIDTKEDYIFTKKIYNLLYNENNIFLTDEILNKINENKDLSKINNKVLRSQQYK